MMQRHAQETTPLPLRVGLGEGSGAAIGAESDIASRPLSLALSREGRADQSATDLVSIHRRPA